MQVQWEGRSRHRPLPVALTQSRLQWELLPCEVPNSNTLEVACSRSSDKEPGCNIVLWATARGLVLILVIVLRWQEFHNCGKENQFDSIKARNYVRIEQNPDSACDARIRLIASPDCRLVLRSRLLLRSLSFIAACGVTFNSRTVRNG